MKKYIVALLFLVSISLSGETVINFYSSNNQPERKAVIRYLLDAFELYNPSISVKLIEYDENNSIDSIVGSNNGITPDIIMADSRLLNRMAFMDTLNYDLTESLLTELGETGFYSGSIRALTLNNRLMAAPYSGWLQVLWYRRDWFEKAGLEPPNTLGSIKKAAEYFSNPKSGRYGIILGTKDEVYTEQCFLQFAEPAGFDLIESGGRWGLDKIELINALNYYNEIKDYAPRGGVSWRARDYYFQNKAAMLVYSTHLMDDLAIKDIAENSLSSENFPELDGEEFTGYLLRNTGMVTSISGEQVSSFGSISGLGIFKSMDIDVIEAQKKLVKFLYREDVYITWLHMSPGGMLPAYKSILNNDNFFRDPSGVFKRYGRDKIIALTQGVENLNLLNSEVLADNPSLEYPEGGLQHLIFSWIDRGDMTLYDLDKKWIFN